MSQRITGLVCPVCRKPIATAGDVGPNGLILTCPDCGHYCYARDLPKD